MRLSKDETITSEHAHFPGLFVATAFKYTTGTHPRKEVGSTRPSFQMLCKMSSQPLSLEWNM